MITANPPATNTGDDERDLLPGDKLQCGARVPRDIYARMTSWTKANDMPRAQFIRRALRHEIGAYKMGDSLAPLSHEPSDCAVSFKIDGQLFAQWDEAAMRANAKRSHFLRDALLRELTNVGA